MPPSGTLSLATPQGMIDGIHGHTPNHRPPSQPTVSSSFPDRDALVLQGTHLTNGGITILQNQANLTRRQFDMSIFSFLSNQLPIGSCGPGQLTPLPYLKLNIMDQRSCRNIPQWKGIARLDIGRWACDHAIAHVNFRGSQDISFFTVRVVE
jgi:hypothetical protein